MSSHADTFIYVDPDRTCLPHMEHTAGQDKARGMTAEACYTKWRAGSNLIANLLLAHAMRHNYNILHGTTSTSNNIKTLFSNLRQDYGYRVNLMHLSCDEATRRASLNKRIASGAIQCTEADFVNKGKLFYTLINTYIGQVDTLNFYYRTAIGPAKPAAKISGSEAPVVWDDLRFASIVDMHQKLSGLSEREIKHLFGLDRSDKSARP